MKLSLTSSSSESLESNESASFSAAAVAPNFAAVETEDTAGEALPTIRASSLAIFEGRDWSDWFEELEEKWRSTSSDIVCPNADELTAQKYSSKH